jgi:hypothetical protein
MQTSIQRKDIATYVFNRNCLAAPHRWNVRSRRKRGRAADRESSDQSQRGAHQKPRERSGPDRIAATALKLRSDREKRAHAQTLRNLHDVFLMVESPCFQDAPGNASESVSRNQRGHFGDEGTPFGRAPRVALAPVASTMQSFCLITRYDRARALRRVADAASQ